MKRRKLLQMLGAGVAFYGPWKVHRAWAQAASKKPLVIGLTMDASGSSPRAAPRSASAP